MKPWIVTRSHLIIHVSQWQWCLHMVARFLKHVFLIKPMSHILCWSKEQGGTWAETVLQLLLSQLWGLVLDTAHPSSSVTLINALIRSDHGVTFRGERERLRGSWVSGRLELTESNNQVWGSVPRDELQFGAETTSDNISWDVAAAAASSVACVTSAASSVACVTWAWGEVYVVEQSWEHPGNSSWDTAGWGMT